MQSRSNKRRSCRLVRHRLPSRQSEATADGDGGRDEAVATGSPKNPPSDVDGYVLWQG